MRFLILILLLPTMIVFAQHSMGEDQTPSLHISGVWTPPTSEDGENIVYLKIENPTEHDLMLSEITSEAVTLLSDGELTLPAGETLTFTADGMVILLSELEEPLEVGDAFVLTLTFAMMDETMDVMIGVPVLEEAPVETPFLIVNPWIRPTVTEKMATPEAHAMQMPQATAEMKMGGYGVTGAFMQIMNTGEEADKLVSASSDVAMMVEVHETTMINDMMQMRHVEDGIDIPAGEMIELKPGSYHIMLMNLNRDIVPGEAVLITLTFESGLEQTIAVPAYDRAMLLMMGGM
jgi:periplasmic copper chaperone A